MRKITVIKGLTILFIGLLLVLRENFQIFSSLYGNPVFEKIVITIFIFLPIWVLTSAINTYKDFKHKTLSKGMFILFEVIYMGYFVILSTVSFGLAISLIKNM